MDFSRHFAQMMSNLGKSKTFLNKNCFESLGNEAKILLYILKSAKSCRLRLLGFMCSAYSRQQPYKLGKQILGQPIGTSSHSGILGRISTIHKAQNC
jgi:hypothetical protein